MVTKLTIVGEYNPSYVMTFEPIEDTRLIFHLHWYKIIRLFCVLAVDCPL